MSKWIGGLTTTVGLCMAMAGMVSAQSKPTQTLTDKDRAEIRQLLDSYVTALDGCKPAEYANLFTADGSFISGPRGTMTGHEKLESLVTTERHCQPGAPAGAAMGHAFSKVVIEPTAEGALGKVYLPGRDPASSGGHYEDRYAKTPDGWRFKSRTYLSPKEEVASAQ
jgi:SnoaL-like domain